MRHVDAFNKSAHATNHNTEGIGDNDRLRKGRVDNGRPMFHHWMHSLLLVVRVCRPGSPCRIVAVHKIGRLSRSTVECCEPRSALPLLAGAVHSLSTPIVDVSHLVNKSPMKHHSVPGALARTPRACRLAVDRRCYCRPRTLPESTIPRAAPDASDASQHGEIPHRSLN